MFRTLAIAALAAALAPGLTACGGASGEMSVLHNARPRARLVAPLVAPVGVPVVVDASHSFDPDGTVVEYTFVFSDGSSSVTLPTPELTHVFTEPGAYEVAVVVRDDGGLLARVNQLVVVRADPLACEENSDCGLGEECRDGLCYASSDLRSDASAECAADPDCGTGWTCRAGICLSTDRPHAY